MEENELPPFPPGFEPNPVKTAICKAISMSTTLQVPSEHHRPEALKSILRQEATFTWTIIEPDDEATETKTQCRLTLDLPTHKHETKGKGVRKQEAKSNSAWLMAKYLVEQQIVKKEDLPQFPAHIPPPRDRDFYQLRPDLQELADIFAPTMSAEDDCGAQTTKDVQGMDNNEKENNKGNNGVGAGPEGASKPQKKRFFN